MSRAFGRPFLGATQSTARLIAATPAFPTSSMNALSSRYPFVGRYMKKPFSAPYRMTSRIKSFLISGSPPIIGMTLQPSVLSQSIALLAVSKSIPGRLLLY